MSEDIFTIVANGAKKLDINLPPTAEAAFRAYYEFLTERGQVINLTAISGMQEIAQLHFLDSIAILKSIDYKNKRIIDIGSGAGFPGVPVKIVEPSVDLTLLEATGKKTKFLSELCGVLNIDATCINARAEDAATRTDRREQYDIAVSRAVARLNILCELCLPFVKTGGTFISMKSVDSTDEATEAQNAINTLGAVIQGHHDYTIPGTDITHRAILLRKIAQTPDKYPRRFARIQKKPL